MTERAKLPEPFESMQRFVTETTLAAERGEVQLFRTPRDLPYTQEELPTLKELEELEAAYGMAEFASGANGSTSEAAPDEKSEALMYVVRRVLATARAGLEEREWNAENRKRLSLSSTEMNALRRASNACLLDETEMLIVQRFCDRQLCATRSGRDATKGGESA